MLLDHRVALVTGAGSGIGRAVAVAYAQAGASVILLGRAPERLEQTYDLITSAGGTASISPLDLFSDLHRVPELASKIAERYGKLDILVNNAAELGTMAALAGYDPAQWETLFRVNVTAPFYLTRELLPLLHRSNRAAVINLSSSVGHQGRAYWGAYAASKAALNNLTETWAEELSPTTIRINTVNPGGTATAMRARAYPGEDPATLPAPEKIVPVFLYLASEFSQENGNHLNARDWLEWQPG